MPPRRWAPILLVALALAVRVGFLLADPYPYANSGLATDSGEIARQIDDHGRWFTSNLTALQQIGGLQNERHRLIDPARVDFAAADAHPRMQPDVLQPVGEAVLLAGVWKLTGSERWLWWQLLTIALDSAMVMVVYAIAMLLFARRRTALIAAGLYAIFPPIAWLSTIPHLDIWAVDLTLLAVALLLRARAQAPVASGGLRWLIAAGVVIGLGSYFRPGLLLLAPLLGLASLRRARWRAAARLVLVPTLVAIVLIVPWTIRNENVFHRFIPLRIGVGQNLWEGLGEIHNDFGAILNDAATGRQVRAVRPNLVYGSPAYDELLQSWATHAIEAHPGFYAKLIGHRLLTSTALLNNSDWAGTVLTPGSAGLSLPDYLVKRPGDVLVLALEPLLFLIALITVLATWRRFAASHLLGLAVIVATLLPYLFLHVEPRYLLPASFIYLIWVGLAVDLLLSRHSSASKAELRGMPRNSVRSGSFGSRSTSRV